MPFATESEQTTTLRATQEQVRNLKAALETYRWIPVGERLPEISPSQNNQASNRVPILFKNRLQIGYHTNFDGWRVEGIRFQKRINQKEITHWMEEIILPETE